MRMLITSLMISSMLSVSLATDHILSESFGIFSSVGFPESYGNNINDSWTITVQRGYRVALYFTSFDLEDSFVTSPCSQDYVEIFDGPDTNYSVKLCGNYDMFPEDAPKLFTRKFRSTGSTMIVRMTSDYSNELPGETQPLLGFRAHYFKEDRNECMELRRKAATSDTPEEVGLCDHFCNNYPGGYYCSCRLGYSLHVNGYSCVGDCSDIVLTNSAGVITTPGYPGNYPGLTDCSWKITTEPGNTLEVKFNGNFSIEDHFEGGCPYDNVKVTDSSKQEQIYCGSVAPYNGRAITAATNWIKIRFHSDADTEYIGFQLTYKTKPILCRLPTPPSHGTLSHIRTSTDDADTPTNYIPFSSLIRFECDKGFRLIGSAKVACLKDGTLSDDPPVCEPF